MSEFTDDTLGRYLDQQPGMREVLLEDPVQHAQTELTRALLDVTERAMSAEGVPESTQHRIVNRIVWGDPEGRVDVYGERRRQAIAVAGLAPSAEQMAALLADDAASVSTDDGPA